MTNITDLYISVISYLGVNLSKDKTLPKYAIKGGCLRYIIRSSRINDIDLFVYSQDSVSVDKITGEIEKLLAEWVRITDTKISISGVREAKLFKFVLTNSEGDKIELEIAS